MNKKIPLTPRLSCIASHVHAKTIADIGTDHAYIPIRLVQDGVCSHAIASDIRQGPLDIAGANIKKYGLADKIETRLGAGLSTIVPNEVQDIIIAGMGGEMIISILAQDEKTAKNSRLILQPMNAQYELRHFLLEHGYKICAEDIAVEGFKVYNLIIATAGEGTKFDCDAFYHLPPYLVSNPNFDALYAKKRRELEKVIRGLEASSSPDEEKLMKYKKWLKELDYYEGL